MYLGPTTDALVSGFPHPLDTIPKIRGKPDRRQLDEILEYITGNAASVTTVLGGGQNGYAALCMSAARYNRLPNTIPFVQPLSPGLYVVDNNPRTTVVMREGQLHDYNAREYQFYMYQHMQQGLKNMFIACVPKECLSKLRSKVSSFNNVSLYTMIAHVYKNHGKISLEMRNDNEDRMKADFDINVYTLEELWVRQDTCQDFLIDEPEKITEPTWLRHTETVLKATGQFTEACEKWEEKDYFDKSKLNFMIHMDEFHTKYVNAKGSLGSVGIANSVELAELKQTIKMDSEKLNAKMNELVINNNDFHDRLDAHSVTSGSVPASIGMASAVTANTATEAKLAALQLQVAQLLQMKQNNNNGDRRNRGRSERGGARGRGSGGRGRGAFDRYADDGRTEKRFPNQNYCYTHGWDVCQGHSSPTCSYPKENHIATATADDTRGGCDLYKRLSHKA